MNFQDASLAPVAELSTDSAQRPQKSSPRWRVRSSGIHGKGAFCVKPISAGDLVGRYDGERLTADQADERHGGSGAHTFLFSHSEGHVIDGGSSGNGTRFVNHGCEPNVEACENGARIEFYAVRDIGRGEELLLDYRLSAEGHEPGEHRCLCGAKSCRGTMILLEE
jgi:SET domain-containing protein